MSQDVIKAGLNVLGAQSSITDMVNASMIVGGEYPKKKAKNVGVRAITLVRSPGSGGLGGYLPLEKQSIDVRCYGNTPRDADNVYRVVREVLKQARRQITAGLLLHGFSPAGSAIALRDNKTKRPFVLSTWLALVSENEAT